MNYMAHITGVIHAPIDRVWKALVDPSDRARYLPGAQVTTDWREGSPMVWKVGGNSTVHEDRGRVLAVREPDLLKYSQLISGQQSGTEEITVTIELKEAGGVTHVRLSQGNYGSDRLRQEGEASWSAILDRLKAMLGEAPVSNVRDGQVMDQ